MGNESLVGTMVFVVLLTTSQAQDGQQGNGFVSDKEPAADSAAAATASRAGDVVK